MKKEKLFVMLFSVALLLAAALESQAASARVRCEVRSNRLRIRVDAQDMPRGTFGAKIKNARTGATATTATNRQVTITVSGTDEDLDFDSSKQANDLAVATWIPYTFAVVGDTIRASVINVKTGVVISAASSNCVAK
jgi:hypothetical protein